MPCILCGNFSVIEMEWDVLGPYVLLSPIFELFFSFSSCWHDYCAAP